MVLVADPYIVTKSVAAVAGTIPFATAEYVIAGDGKFTVPITFVVSGFSIAVTVGEKDRLPG